MHCAVQVFHLKAAEAAKVSFNVGNTRFKEALRKSFSIVRWPSCTLNPPRRVLRYYEAAGPAEDATWLR